MHQCIQNVNVHAQFPLIGLFKAIIKLYDSGLVDSSTPISPPTLSHVSLESTKIKHVAISLVLAAQHLTSIKPV